MCFCTLFSPVTIFIYSNEQNKKFRVLEFLGSKQNMGVGGMTILEVQNLFRMLKSTVIPGAQLCSYLRQGLPLSPDL